RDDLVTGVQTCALPICYRFANIMDFIERQGQLCARLRQGMVRNQERRWFKDLTEVSPREHQVDARQLTRCARVDADNARPRIWRSEERRVGKESGCGWG